MRIRPFVVLLALASACATSSGSRRSDAAANPDPSSPLGRLAIDMEAEQRRSAQVAARVDEGVSLHFAGKYAESNTVLSQAEAKMKEVVPRAQPPGAMGAPPALEYTGPAYERLLIHVLRTLNLLFLDQSELAVLEARKAATFLKDIKGTPAAAGLKEDLLVPVLQQLANEDAGLGVEAAQAAKEAKSTGAKPGTKAELEARTFSAPMKKGEGEIVVVHYNGPPPRIETQQRKASWEEALFVLQALGGPDVRSQLASPEVANARFESLDFGSPILVQDPFRIAAPRLSVKSKEWPVPLAMDVASFARAIVDDPAGTPRQRALARSALQVLNARLAGRPAESDRTAGAIPPSVGWPTLAPRSLDLIAAQIRLGHAHVPAGKQKVEVLMQDAAGKVLRREAFPDVVVKAGKRTWLQVRTVE